MDDLSAPAISGNHRFYGAVIGIVTNNDDPKAMGRVKVKLPWLSQSNESNWARVASPMAGPGRGIHFLPEVDDEVLVMFEHGYIERPFVIGSLWNGKDKPPEATAGGLGSNDEARKKSKNQKRVIKSTSGHVIVFDDTPDAEKISIIDKSGGNSIELDTKTNLVTITSKKDLAITAEGNIRISNEKGELAITCKTFSVDAKQGYELKGPQGKLEASGGMALTCAAGVNVNNGALEVK